MPFIIDSDSPSPDRTDVNFVSTTRPANDCLCNRLRRLGEHRGVGFFDWDDLPGDNEEGYLRTRVSNYMILCAYSAPEEVQTVLHYLQQTLQESAVCTSYIRRSTEGHHWCMTSLLESGSPLPISMIQGMFEIWRGEDRSNWAVELPESDFVDSWRASKISHLDGAGLMFLATGLQDMKMMVLEGDVEGFFRSGCVNIIGD